MLGWEHALKNNMFVSITNRLASPNSTKNNPKGGMKVCAKCHKAWYCSAACQQAAFWHHKRTGTRDFRCVPLEVEGEEVEVQEEGVKEEEAEAKGTEVEVRDS